MTAVEIRYDGTDITALCSISETTFTGRANGTPGDCTIIIRDLEQDQTFVAGKTLELYLDGSREWDGYLVTKSYRYWFEGHTANCQPCDHLTPRRIELRGADRNILFTRRVLFDQAEPTRTDKIYPAGTNDSDLIAFWVANYLDPTDGIDYSTNVDTVASPDPYSEIDLPGPSNYFGDFMRELSQATSAVFYIDPDRTLQYHDVNSVTAPFTITDKPALGEVGCRELTILNRADEMVNDCLVWGAGQGKDHITFSRSTDDTSVTTHQRWQKGLFKMNLWRQASADRIAETTVYGSPSSHRGHKDDAVAVEFVIFEPGIRVADKVNFRSDVFGFTDVIPVRELTISFPAGPENVQYRLRLSHELDEPWTTVEYWRPKREIGVPRCPTINCSVPHSGTPILTTTLTQPSVDTSIYNGGQSVAQGNVTWHVGIEGGQNIIYWEDTGGPMGVSGNGLHCRYELAYEDALRYTGAILGPWTTHEIVHQGGQVECWRTEYGQYKAPENPFHEGYTVTGRLQATLTFTDYDYPRSHFGENGSGLPAPSVGPAHLILVNMPYPRKVGENYPLRTIGPVIVEAEMIHGDEVSIDTYLNFQGGETFGLSVQIFDVRTTGGVVLGAEARLHSIQWTWYPNRPQGLIWMDDCVEIPVCGQACMNAIYDGPNVGGDGEKYRLTVAYISGSLTVAVDGIQLRHGIDFIETNPWAGEFLLTVDRTAYPGTPYACFDGGGFALGSSLPVSGAFFVPPVVAPISGTFGAQTSTWPELIWHGVYYPHFHNGVDFSVGVGTPVYAAADGFVNYVDQAAGGMMIQIYHATGLRTVYAHLSDRLVPNGSTVTQGELIALSGDSGQVTGPHLHWGMVFAGSPENPLPYCTLPAGPGTVPLTYE